MKQYVLNFLFFFLVPSIVANERIKETIDGLEIMYNPQNKEFSIEEELCPGTRLYTFSLGQETSITVWVLILGHGSSTIASLPESINQAFNKFKTLHCIERQEEKDEK